MDLIAAGPSHHVSNCKSIDPAGRKYFDSRGSVANKGRDVDRPIVGAGFLPRSHHPRDSQINQSIESCQGVRHDIEGAMKNHFTPGTQLLDLATTFQIDSAGGGENPERNSSRAFSQRQFSVTLHDFEFTGAV